MRQRRNAHETDIDQTQFAHSTTRRTSVQVRRIILPVKGRHPTKISHTDRFVAPGVAWTHRPLGFISRWLQP